MVRDMGVELGSSGCGGVAGCVIPISLRCRKGVESSAWMDDGSEARHRRSIFGGKVCRQMLRRPGEFKLLAPCFERYSSQNILPWFLLLPQFAGRTLGKTELFV